MNRDATTATAVFSDAFQFPGTELNPGAPELIERDRLIMAARPGMIRKLLPLLTNSSGVFCGGCYLFDTYENAKGYADWVANEFVLDGLDGKLFLDRPEFLEPTSQLWLIAGFEDFADVADAQTVMRFERWHIPEQADLDAVRRNWWPGIRSAAIAAGMTSVWLLISPDRFHPQLGIVTVARGNTAEAADVDAPSLRSLAARPSLGAALAAELRGTRVFDRTSWIYMIWHPIAEGDQSPHTAQWPASPPLPGLKVLRPAVLPAA